MSKYNQQNKTQTWTILALSSLFKKKWCEKPLANVSFLSLRGAYGGYAKSQVEILYFYGIVEGPVLFQYALQSPDGLGFRTNG